MFKRILLWSFLLLAVTVSATAYHYADWLQTERNIYHGRQAFQNGEFQVAVNHLNPVVAKPAAFSVACWNRSDCSTYLRRQLAQSHLALGQDDAALGHYRQLTDSTARFVQGLDALKIGKWEESVEHFKSALQSEGECESCRDALKSAQEAKAAYVSGEEAKQVQAKVLADMTAPVKCLAFVSGVAVIRVGASTVVNPQLVAVIRKAGATKRVAEEAISHLVRTLSPALVALFSDLTGDVCPPLSSNESIKWALENETVKWLWDLDRFDLIRGDAHRVASAVSQTVVMAGLIFQYGQAFNAERASDQQTTDAKNAQRGHWDRIVEASKNPKFIESGLRTLRTPVASPSGGWIARTLGTINPANWFSK